MKCIICEEEIHPKRLEIIPNTKTCAKHSTVEKHKCMTVQYGEGDHTYDDIVILKEEDAWDIEQSEKNLRQIIEEEDQKESEDVSIIEDEDKLIETLAKNSEFLKNDIDDSDLM